MRTRRHRTEASIFSRISSRITTRIFCAATITSAIFWWQSVILSRMREVLTASMTVRRIMILIPRCTEKARKIVHIPRVLYHWRTHPQSTADNPISKQYAYDAGKRAIEAHLARVGETGCTVERKKDFGFYRVHYPVKSTPLVSIIIPNKDEKETLEKCLASIREKTTYENYEIIVVENNSKTGEIFSYYKEIDGRNGVHVVDWDREFNYSATQQFRCGQGFRRVPRVFKECMWRSSVKTGWKSCLAIVREKRRALLEQDFDDPGRLRSSMPGS